MKPGILFLDDDKNLLQSIKRFLYIYKDEWNMYFAESFGKATTILQNETIDVALLDIHLPVKNGFELLKYIKSDNKLKNIEIVMLTGMEEQKLKREALAAGAADLLQKPIQPEDLIARIKSTLKVKQFQDQLTFKNECLRAELIKSQKMELTGILAAGITHDIRNILSVIANYPDIIKRKLEIRESVEQELKKIEIASYRAESLLRQILNFTRKVEPGIYEIDLNTVILEVSGLLEAIIPSTIILEINLSVEPLFGIYNKQYLIQIIMNLIINARDAIENQKGKIEISTEQVTAFDNESNTNIVYNKMVVKDYGKGINNEELDKIFENSYSSKETLKNFGFGLSVIKMLVENLKGKIEIKSEKQQGTSFIIYFPVGD